MGDLREVELLQNGVRLTCDLCLGLAAFDERRPTRDVDLAGLNLANDAETVLELVRSIVEASSPLEDGVVFLPETARSEVIREEDAYSGIRVSMGARLASASLPFHVDINVGDPIWPAPSTVEVPRLRGGEPIVLPGYPIHMVHAEKIVTATQRGVANTRWRDFADPVLVGLVDGTQWDPRNRDWRKR